MGLSSRGRKQAGGETAGRSALWACLLHLSVGLVVVAVPLGLAHHPLVLLRRLRLGVVLGGVDDVPAQGQRHEREGRQNMAPQRMGS